MFCRQCGKPLPDNTNFCPHCGTQCSNSPENKTPAAPVLKPITLPNIQLSKQNLIVLILCAAMLFSLLVLPAMTLYRQSGSHTYSQTHIYFLGECDWPSAITNAADMELLMRMSLVGFLVCLTAIVFFTFKDNRKACLYVSIANCALSLLDVGAFANGIASKYNWKASPFGPLLYFVCALITILILYKLYKKDVRSAAKPSN